MPDSCLAGVETLGSNFEVFLFLWEKFYFLNRPLQPYLHLRNENAKNREPYGKI